jgi:SNF2 family DNA or RNA helicase
LVLFSDASKNTGFFVKRHDVNDIEYLLLCHSNEIISTSSNLDRDTKIFFMKSFFEKINGEDLVALELKPKLTNSTQGRELSLDDFYERLRQAHENDDLLTGLPSEVQHSSLRPILRPYQKRGISWMLKRELKTESLPPFYIKLRSKFNKNQTIYYNTYTQILLSECPEDEKVPKGGLLTGNYCFENVVQPMHIIIFIF